MKRGRAENNRNVRYVVDVRYRPTMNYLPPLFLRQSPYLGIKTSSKSTHPTSKIDERYTAKLFAYGILF